MQRKKCWKYGDVNKFELNTNGKGEHLKIDLCWHQVCIFSYIFVVSAWHSKYINKSMGLQCFFLFPLVVSLSVVCSWLLWLLYEQPPSTSYSLRAPHDSSRGVQITLVQQTSDETLLTSSTLPPLVFLPVFIFWCRGVRVVMFWFVSYKNCWPRHILIDTSRIIEATQAIFRTLKSLRTLHTPVVSFSVFLSPFSTLTKV